jgi:hypothetical protein
MTTEALRKAIKVTDWKLSENGLTISYERDNHNPKSLHLVLSPKETIKELSIVGSIEQVNEFDLMALWCSCWYYWPQIPISYKMCQWEALSIAIRHEEEKELANDMNMLELDSAIQALRDY